MECWRIYKTHFEAAHYIDNDRIKTDKCHTLHGHSYHLTVKVKGDTEVWLDFHTIKEKVQKILEAEYDEKNLGDASLEEVVKALKVDIAIELGMKESQAKTDLVLEIMETDKHGIQA